MLARITGLTPDEHAFVGNASEGIARVISSIDWRPGDNVVVSEKDYKSGLVSLLRLARVGAEPRVVPCPGWRIDQNALIDACDGNTRLLYINQVTSLTGQKFDVAALSEGLGRRGVIFLLDASYAMDVAPVDAWLADFTVSSGYKFLCSSHTGLFAWNKERHPDFEPMAVGWASGSLSDGKARFTPYDGAARAEVGNPNYLDFYVMRESLDLLLSYGIGAIVRHVADADPQKVEAETSRNNIFVWGESGRVQASPHLFNSVDDVDRYLAL